MDENLDYLLPDGEYWVEINEDDFDDFYQAFVMGFCQKKAEIEHLDKISTCYLHDEADINYFMNSDGYLLPIYLQCFGDYWVRSSLFDEFKKSYFYEKDREKLSGVNEKEKKEKIEKLKKELESLESDQPFS